MQNPLDRINDRTAEQLQKERSKSFEPLMNKTKKSAELLGFIDPFFQAHLSIGKYGHSKVVGVGSGHFRCKNVSHCPVKL